MDGRTATPGGYVAAKEPDIIAADDYLGCLLREEPALRTLLKAHYRFIIADGGVPVYIRNPAPVNRLP